MSEPVVEPAPEPTPAELYVAEVAVITARIETLKTLKAQAMAAAVANVDPELVTDSLREEIGRPYESEINTLLYKKNARSIAFAESFIA
jgi:hypothetical protein